MGIPLAALGINQQPGPLEQVGKALQLKALQQNQQYQAQAQPLELQQRQQQVQQGQMQLADQQAMTKALQAWDGKDVEELPGMVLKHGGSAQAVFGLKNQIVEQRKNLATADEATLKNLNTRNDILAGHLETLKSSTDKEGDYQKMVTDLTQQGIAKPGQMPPQYPGDDKLAQFEKGLMGQKQITEQAMKERETKAKESEAQTRATQATTASQRLQAEMPGGALESPDRAEMHDYLAKHPGQGPADYAKWKSTLAPLAQINVAAGAGGGLTDTAKDQAAEKYWQTGTLPPASRGAAGLVQNRSIMNRAAELHPTGNLAANSAEYKANSAALSKVQTQSDTVEAFENTALKNLDQVLKAAEAIPDAGSKLANTPIRAFESKVVGTEAMARLNAALLTGRTESARVLNSANATGVLTNEARGEVEQILSGNMTYPAMKAAINQLKVDMGNRKQSYRDQISDIKGRLGGSSSAPTAAGKPPEGATHIVPGPDGKKHYTNAAGTIDYGIVP